MDGIKTMDSLPILRANKTLVKHIKLKERKLKTSPVSVVECFERSWPLPQPKEPGVINREKILIICII